MNEGEPMKNMVVFVLEREPVDREQIRTVVANLGCAVISLDSGDAIVNLLKNGEVCDLIILAVSALDDDPDCFDRIMAARPRPPQIIFCGMDDKARLVLHGLNKGVRDFIAKPINADELCCAVETVLGTNPGAGYWRRSDAIVGSIPVGKWLELTASSELEQFRRFQRFSDVLLESNLPRQLCEDLKMAVEEVGRNAVEWGNRFDPDKRVHISACLFKDRVVIKVEDEGEGFKPDLLPDPTADPMKTMRDRMDAGKRPGGYGVYLIQKLVDEVAYNEKGNIVLLIKYLPKKADV